MNRLSAEEALYSCVRCGACRESCPTLDITGREADGPRGRVLLSRSLIEGAIPVNEEIENQLDRCLLCSACVDACPVEVPVPDIIMLAKEKIIATKREPTHIEFLRKIFFEKLLPYPKRLQFLGTLLWIYQKIGLQKIARKLGIFKLLPETVRQMEEILPEIPAPVHRKPLPVVTPPYEDRGNSRQQKAGMFHGCIMDMMFRQTNENSIRLLAGSGYTVITPSQQLCCGALHLHNGKKNMAMELAKRNIEVFEQADVDVIVTNAGGCGAMLKEYGELLREDPEWCQRAEDFSGKIRDISELLVEQETGIEAVGAGERITYQPSCHLQYVMRVKDAPKKLLKGVRNANYVELPESHLCCGSAGIYNLLQPGLAFEILDKKMKQVETTRSDIIITANPGCLLQMKIGIQRAGLRGKSKAVHIVDYLAEAMERAEKERA